MSFRDILMEEASSSNQEGDTENKTLRDEFAMNALNGMASNPKFMERLKAWAGIEHDTSVEDEAHKRAINYACEYAYTFADAMMEARKQ